jgi:1-acyl-sn-glycerol-3-phosphate acyltransferase
MGGLLFRRMRDITYPPTILVARAWFRLGDIRPRVEGAEHIPRRGGAVIASTHVSYLDFVFCGLAARSSRRYIRFMAKEAVFRHRLAGPLMRSYHHIPVDRAAGAASYRHAVQALRDGELVGVFPEATISHSFTVKEIKSGAVRMAAAAGVPLVPVSVWGAQRMLTKGQPNRLLRRHVPILILVGEPMYPERGDDWAARQAELRSRLQDLLDRAQREYPDRPRGPEDRWWLPAHLGGTAPAQEEAAAMDRLSPEE